MLRLELLGQLELQRLRGDARGIGHSSVDGGEGSRGEGEGGEGGALGRNWTEEIATASAQDSEGGGAGEHQGSELRR